MCISTLWYRWNDDTPVMTAADLVHRYHFLSIVDWTIIETDSNWPWDWSVWSIYMRAWESWKLDFLISDLALELLYYLTMSRDYIWTLRISSIRVTLELVNSGETVFLVSSTTILPSRWPSIARKIRMAPPLWRFSSLLQLAPPLQPRHLPLPHPPPRIPLHPSTHHSTEQRLLTWSTFGIRK